MVVKVLLSFLVMFEYGSTPIEAKWIQIEVLTIKSPISDNIGPLHMFSSGNPHLPSLFCKVELGTTSNSKMI